MKTHMSSSHKSTAKLGDNYAQVTNCQRLSLDRSDTSNYCLVRVSVPARIPVQSDQENTILQEFQRLDSMEDILSVTEQEKSMFERTNGWGITANMFGQSNISQAIQVPGGPINEEEDQEVLQNDAGLELATVLGNIYKDLRVLVDRYSGFVTPANTSDYQTLGCSQTLRKAVLNQDNSSSFSRLFTVLLHFVCICV